MQNMMLWRALFLVPLASSIHAFSFSFSNKPTQCNNLTVTVDGGTPPYRLVMIPSGPLVNRPEIRTIVDQQFNGTSFTLPPLAFPGESNFTAVMSDSTGVGTGGTSVITDVADSGDSSCLSTSSTNPLFYLELPSNPTLTQCGSMQISFSDTTQGTITLMGIIPGGESFSISVDSGSRTASWSPICVPAGTGVMLVAGDDRGRGTGGSTYVMVVQNGDDSCLHGSNTVYSTTPAPYAGGQYATGSGGGTVTGPWNNGPTNGSGSSGMSKSSKIGMIVGIVCGVVALILIALIVCVLYRRRRARNDRYAGTKEVDLLKDRPAAVSGPEHSQLEPTPFYAPDHNAHTPPENSNSTHRPSTSISSGYNNGDQHSTAPLVPPSAWNPNAMNNRPTTPSGRSGYEGTEYTSAGHSVSDHTYGSVPASPTTGGWSGAGMTKSAEGPARLRPLNVIQHADGGTMPITETSPPPEEDAVVELPPSYNDVRRADGVQSTSPR